MSTRDTPAKPLPKLRKKHGIRLEVVKHTEAKRGFEIAPWLCTYPVRHGHLKPSSSGGEFHSNFVTAK